MKVALTGHRPQRLGLSEDETDEKWSKITNWLTEQITKMTEVAILSNTYVDAYCGMASGCDISFGFVVSVIKNGTKNLKLHCILPCKDYNSSNKYYTCVYRKSRQRPTRYSTRKVHPSYPNTPATTRSPPGLHVS